MSEVIRNSITNFFVFTGEETTSGFDKDDFGAELGVIFGDFTTGGAAADDEGDFR